MIPGLIFGAGAIAIGMLFIVNRQQLCQHGCWLDEALDALLPMELEAFSGGVPWIVVGLALVIHAIYRR
jgi:hypothetical protein